MLTIEGKIHSVCVCVCVCVCPWGGGGGAERMVEVEEGGQHDAIKINIIT